MAIYVKTKNPEGLCNSIDRMLKEGGIDTWLLDDDGDYTHAPVQWQKKAWIRPYPKKEDEYLSFGILGRKDEQMTKQVYAVYHGRFAEMLLAHFDDNIDDIKITSFVVKGLDYIE